MYLAHRILRIKIKGQGARKPAKPEDEPDFYEKPYLPVSATIVPMHTTPSLSGVYNKATKMEGGAGLPPAPFLTSHNHGNHNRLNNSLNNHNNMAYLLQQAVGAAHQSTAAAAFHPAFPLLPGLFVQQQQAPPHMAGLFSPEVMAAWQQSRGGGGGGGNSLLSAASMSLRR
jgi:hypothetical protein